MANVFIIGATGGIGSRLGAQLAARGDHPAGLHRQLDQARTLSNLGIRPVAGDLTSMSAQELAAQCAGIDAVVFAAGASDAGSSATDAVDGRGLVLAARAAELAGVRRFLHISAFPDAWRDQRMPPDFEHYMKVKRLADVHLAATKLDWVIVRPGTLSNRPGSGRVRAGLAIPYGDVARDDVASVLAELVHTPEIKRVILELTGGDIPIRAALLAGSGAE